MVWFLLTLLFIAVCSGLCIKNSKFIWLKYCLTDVCCCRNICSALHQSMVTGWLSLDQCSTVLKTPPSHAGFAISMNRWFLCSKCLVIFCSSLCSQPVITGRRFCVWMQSKSIYLPTFILADISRWTWVSQFPIYFLLALFPGQVAAGFLLPCYPTTVSKHWMERGTDSNQWPGCILSSSTTRLLKEWALLLFVSSLKTLMPVPVK